MKNATKGALAAGAAGVLLTGGAGSLAYWSDSETIGGGDIDSGVLSLTQGTGQNCSAWTLDGGTAYTAGTTQVVPGDVITRTCTYTVNATGEHLSADLGLETASVTASNELASALTPAATYTLGGEPVTDGADITSAHDGDALVATIKVTFASSTSGLTAQNQTAVLEDLTVSLTQNHA